MTKVKTVNKTTKKARKIVQDIVAYTLLTLACLAVICPFLIVLSISFKTDGAALRVPFRFFPERWQDINFKGYSAVVNNSDIWNGLKNTLIVVVPIMFIGVFTSALSAYAFAKIEFKAKGAMFSVLMFSMMLPGVITMTPAYVLYDMIGWTNTFLPLMIPNAFGTVSCMFYLRQYFRGLPNEMIEAAEIDGLGRFGAFIYIILPLSKPALIAQLVLWFIAGYNDYMGPLLYLAEDRLFTLQRVFQNFVGSTTELPMVTACCIIMMIPTLLLYFFAQRQFIEGIVMTGMKD